MENNSNRKVSNFELKLYSLVDENAKDKPLPKYFNYFIMVLIVLNVFTMILETVEEIYQPYKVIFHSFEIFVIIIFTAEYLIRLITADLAFPSTSRLKSILKYIFSFYGLIDLLAILPFYMPFTSLDLRVVRTLRLLRFLRLFKIARYNNSLELIKSVMYEKRSELGVTCFVIIVVMIIASFLMFYAEHSAQPENFPNVLTCIWWSIVTLTTVGYGDVFPVTGVGRLLGGIIAFLGIGLVALPTGLISAGFLEKINQKSKEEDKKEEELIDKKSENLQDICNHNSDNKHYCPYCGHKLD
ncbi:MAG: ion transporter [Bacteroidales bacterium]|nr:ion transporter [Bacteroidales bacterium]